MDLITPWHLLVILIIALIVFGPRRLPELGRSLGDAIREFRSATSNAINAAGEASRPAATEKGAGQEKGGEAAGTHERQGADEAAGPAKES
ncbi:MAG: twin-arginine translocase TatA/TatE family subunit [Firmicutes bacterium]|nr:twin-arginine translocase TatA/TatE family subunit [Bacillota bacterium]